MQKVALSPLYMKKEKGEEINSAINRARIDGVWFALGLLEDKFTYEELLKMYVSLSYQADVRVEKRGKVEALIEKSSDDYNQMLTPIIEEFINSKLITKEENRFEKIQSLTRNEAMKRIQQLRLINFLTNYIKNPLTSPLNRAVLYALAKINRVRDSNKREKQ